VLAIRAGDTAPAEAVVFRNVRRKTIAPLFQQPRPPYPGRRRVGNKKLDNRPLIAHNRFSRRQPAAYRA